MKIDSFATVRHGFTLIELLMACAVLTIMVFILAQVVEISDQAFSSATKKLDAAEQARMVFDRLATDLASRPRRGDLGMNFTKGGGNGNSDTLLFYSEVSGYAGSRQVTSVGYQVQTLPATYQLERGATGTNWTGSNPLVFLQSPPNANPGTLPQSPPAPAAADYDVLAGGVFRLELCYLLNTGTFSNSNGSNPANPSDYSQVVALVVAVAVLDDNSRNLIVPQTNPTSTAQLVQLAGDLPVCVQGSDPLTTWNSAMASGSFASNLPKAVVENLRVYQRAFSLP